MSVRVALADIIDGLEMQSDRLTSYLDRRTGQVVVVSDDAAMDAEMEAEEEEEDGESEDEELAIARDVLSNSSDYVALPDRFEIDEYRMMRQFAASVRDGAELERALHGKGAFRYFKDTVRRLGRQEEWNQFRNKAYERVAIDWCEENGIEYDRDAPPWFARNKPS